jgi:hypothetical protein
MRLGLIHGRMVRLTDARGLPTVIGLDARFSRRRDNLILMDQGKIIF